MQYKGVTVFNIKISISQSSNSKMGKGQDKEPVSKETQEAGNHGQGSVSTTERGRKTKELPLFAVRSASL